MKFSKLALCLSGALILGFAPVVTPEANATSLNSSWTYSIDAAMMALVEAALRLKALQ
ncbi:MAG: hypothetical protein HC772_20720 [Leptolyngbyaceae cyanobacterium CRU_2_3]|nr:hypothetical protein [Leptolyngbyaceae cyanobacterium CRU_2_3]